MDQEVPQQKWKSHRNRIILQMGQGKVLRQHVKKVEKQGLHVHMGAVQ